MLRWIHKSWKVFWEAVLTVVLLIVVLGGIGIGLLQLRSTKGIIVDKIETKFNESHRGVLSIGKLEGFVPFEIELKNVALTISPDSVTTDTLISVKSAHVGINLWALWRDKLSINTMHLVEPKVRLYPDKKGGYTLSAALSNTHKQKNEKTERTSSFFPTIEISAPEITINNGIFFAKKPPFLSKNIILPAPFTASDIDAQLFIDLSSDNRFINIDQLSGNIHRMNAGKIAVSGQIFNNNKTLEFNGFELQIGSSQLRLNGKINNLDISRQNIRTQLNNASLDLQISSGQFFFAALNDVLPVLPDISQPMSFDTHITGGENDIHLEKLQASIGESSLNIHGSVSELFKKNERKFNLQIDTLHLNRRLLKALTDSVNSGGYASLQYLELSGTISGVADSISARLSGNSGLGSISLKGKGTLSSPYSFEGSLKGHGVDAAPFIASRIDTTHLDFEAQFSAQQFTPDSLKGGTLKINIQAHNSFINDVRFDHLQLSATMRNGKMDANYSYRYNNQKITGKAGLNLNRNLPHFQVKGKTTALNLAAYLSGTSVDSTNLNATYQFILNGIKPEHMYGSVQLNIDRSSVNGTEIQSHQLKLKLTSPGLNQNSLTVSSPFFNLLAKGNISPANVYREVKYWSAYFKNRLNEEILLDSTRAYRQPAFSTIRPLQLEGHLVAKDITLIKKYWPAFPLIKSNSVAGFQLRADSVNLRFSSRIVSDTLRLNNIRVKDAETNISGHFNHNQTLKESGNLTFTTTAEKINTGFAKMDSLNLQLRYRKNSLFYAQQIKNISKGSQFNLNIDASLAQDDIRFSINNFFLGNKQYSWQTVGEPVIIYNRGKKIEFHSFKVKNGDGYFALKGAQSPNPSDSLQYIIHHINLASVADLINGKFHFSGFLNGRVQTSSLTRSPSIQGQLAVDRFALEGRLIGDITFSTALNKKLKRYDTTLKILTDSTKYQSFLAKNNGIGQDISLNGYFIPAGFKDNSQTLLHFKANIDELGTWFAQLFMSNVFKRVRGAARGSAMITGTLSKPNIQAKVNLDDVNIRIGFLGTSYDVNGDLTFNNNKKGLVLHQLTIADQQGGTGTASGYVDFNDFNPTKFIHLTVAMDDIRFVHSQFSLNTPFFGDVSASGVFNLEGPTNDLTLKSPDVIQISPNSTFGYPLLSETPLYGNSNFIKFVESLKHPEQASNEPRKETEHNFFNDDHLTFGERFNLDLQFAAQRPINFRIIFDPVTKEHIAAKGTGRMRLIMHEGNTQLFGHFRVTGGTYQFVVAGIFSRKFEIAPGGNIIWEGKPANARINMHASYTARPTVASLFNANQKAQNESDNPVYRRIPVKMIIQLTGELQHSQTQIHFELPSTFNISTNSQVNYILNGINSNRQESFKQAASLLMTGNFLPSGFSSNQTSQLVSSLSNGSAYIGPFLSNQIINPLVSQQVNSLFANDWAHFNFDIRFNQFNQIGLGVSLSLLNDQLVLRRDGLLTTGNAHYTNRERIGNLSATYYFNNHLSLLAFHRQDLFLGSTLVSDNAEVSPGIVQDVNGLGIKTDVQFNTWQQLLHKTQNFFRRLLGKDEIDFKKRKKAPVNDPHGNPMEPNNEDGHI